MADIDRSPSSDTALPDPALPRTAEPAAAEVPLVVDLDGTLVRSDLLVESLFVLAKRRPLRLLRVPFWLARGRAYLKRRLADEARPDVRTLPYRHTLLAHLEEEKRRGRLLVLATAQDEAVAGAVARHLGLFDVVLASDGRVNLKGEEKRAHLVARFGTRGYDYVGTGRDDLASWNSAREAVLVQAAPALAGRLSPEVRVRELPLETRLAPWRFRVLRPYQWLKNTLVFVPMVAAHQLYDLGLLLQATLGFVAFSLCASSAYILNDLMDLPSDRQHPRKKNRPLASGLISPLHASAMIPLLLVGSIAIALLLPAAFLAVLTGYYALTLAYSFRLKDAVIVDVLALALLYTLRVMAGAAATSIVPSAWLLAFCVFLFFSLAMVKRYAELTAMRAVEGPHAHARGYLLEDSELLAALGGASGYLAVLVLALYITSDSGPNLDPRQHLIWLVCILLLYWISYMWLMAHRARMHDDPLVFAFRDRVSRILVVLMAAIVFAAT